MNTLTGLILISGTSKGDADIRYLSGFTAPDSFVYVKTESSGHLIVSTMEQGRALREARTGIEVTTPAELGLRGKKAGRLDLQVAALVKQEGIKRIKVSPDIPAGVFQQLLKRGLPVSILKQPVCPERAIKTLPEIASIRASQRAAVAAMEAAVDLIAAARIDRRRYLRRGRELLTAEYVQRKIRMILMEHDCSAEDTIVACGAQAEDPHERGSGPLLAGQAIIIDIFPRSDRSGYWGDLTRTVCRGPAPPALRQLYRAVKAAQAAALRTVRPGICSDEVHAAAQAVFAGRGYRTEKINGRPVGFIHGTGHGVGLEIHERPRVAASGEILQAGHVITVEPGLYYTGLGGVRIEDTVVVTDKGWRYAAQCAKKFELL
jgi:Xaa-Pro aminopeptidase